MNFWTSFSGTAAWSWLLRFTYFYFVIASFLYTPAFRIESPVLIHLRRRSFTFPLPWYDDALGEGIFPAAVCDSSFNGSCCNHGFPHLAVVSIG
jgi:hypothetical protein